MLILGVSLSVPACLIAAWAPNEQVLIAARILGGLSAGMAYPTTLALITALWSGPARTRSIALWSAIGGAISALGPLVVRCAAGRVLVGIGVPRHPAAGRGRARAGDQARAGPRQRDERPGRQPRRNPLRGHGRVRSSSRSTSPQSRMQRPSLSASRSSPSPPRSGSSSANGARSSRSTTSTSLGGGSSGSPRWRESSSSGRSWRRRSSDSSSCRTSSTTHHSIPGPRSSRRWSSWCWSRRGRPS